MDVTTGDCVGYFNDTAWSRSRGFQTCELHLLFLERLAVLVPISNRVAVFAVFFCLQLCWKYVAMSYVFVWLRGGQTRDTLQYRHILQETSAFCFTFLSESGFEPRYTV